MDKKKSVVQDWMNNLSWKQQTVVLSAIRGCDGVPKDDVSKKIHKYLRAAVLENAGTSNTSFMKVDYDDPLMWEEMTLFRRDIDKYPTHYILHFMHAAEILGYFHPSPRISRYWFNAYNIFVDAMHLYPETVEQNMKRLMDGVDSD